MKYSWNVLLMLFIALTMAACGLEPVTPEPEPEPEPEPVATGFFKGSVRSLDASFELVPLSEVTIEAFQGQEIGSNTTSDAEGKYEMEVEVGEGYELRLTKDGYLPSIVENLNMTEDESIFLAAILQINEQFDGEGTAAGIITDALNGQPKAGVEIQLRKNINARTGTVVTTATTDASGVYKFTNLQAGHYTAEASVNGYSTTFFTIYCLGGRDTDGQNHSITPVLADGEVRIILDWGATPSDLDAHLTGPDGNDSRFHVYFENENPTGANANLDVDDTNSFGPETITITESREGVYRYSVHDFSNRGLSASSALSESSCRVRVFQGTNGGTEELAEYNVPNEPGTLWTIFEMEDGEITVVNQMSYENDPVDVRSNPYDAALMVRLPNK